MDPPQRTEVRPVALPAARFGLPPGRDGEPGPAGSHRPAQRPSPGPAHVIATQAWQLAAGQDHQTRYQPLRAVGLLTFLYLTMLLTFWAAQHQHGVIVPVDGTRATATVCTSMYPCFYPAGYASDTVVPIISLGQSSHWGINAAASWGWAYTTAQLDRHHPRLGIRHPRRRRIHRPHPQGITTSKHPAAHSHSKDHSARSTVAV